MRVFSGGISTETNTFSPMPTGMRDYRIVRAEDGANEAIFPAIDRFKACTKARGWDYLFSLSPTGREDHTRHLRGAAR